MRQASTDGSTALEADPASHRSRDVDGFGPSALSPEFPGALGFVDGVSFERSHFSSFR